MSEEKTVNKLTSYLDDINKSKSDTKYVKFADQDKKVFLFDPEKVEKVFKHWNGSTYEESVEFKDGYKTYYRFIVQDPNMNNIERIWDCTNFKCAEDIMKLLLTKHYLIKIKRIGTDKNTIYDVEIAD